MEKEKNNYEISVDEIKKLNLSDDMKNILLEMNKLWWEYSNWTPNSQSFDWKTAEGIEKCMEIIKKHSS
jgi:hypothetical protein